MVGAYETVMTSLLCFSSYMQPCQAVVHSYVSCSQIFFATVTIHAHIQSGPSGNVYQIVMRMWQNLHVTLVKHTVKDARSLLQKVDAILRLKHDKSVSTYKGVDPENFKGYY